MLNLATPRQLCQLVHIYKCCITTNDVCAFQLN